MSQRFTATHIANAAQANASTNPESFWDVKECVCPNAREKVQQNWLIMR
jgi:hypothetical protein